MGRMSSKQEAQRRLRWLPVVWICAVVIAVSGCADGVESQALPDPDECVLPRHTLAQWREVVLERAARIKVTMRDERHQRWRLFDIHGRPRGRITFSRVEASTFWTSSSTACA